MLPDYFRKIHQTASLVIFHSSGITAKLVVWGKGYFNSLPLDVRGLSKLIARREISSFNLLILFFGFDSTDDISRLQCTISTLIDVIKFSIAKRLSNRTGFLVTVQRTFLIQSSHNFFTRFVVRSYALVT
jgi:hypothetical protein